MPYGRYRRYGRSRRRGGYPNNGVRSLRMATRREIPTYTPGKAYCKKLVHVVPVQSLTPSILLADPTASAATRFHLNYIDQGDGISNRHANKTLIRMLYLNCLLSTKTYPIAANGILGARMVVLWDREARGLPPSFTDVFDTVEFTAFPRFAYRERFQILYDRVYLPSADTAWFNTISQAGILGFRRNFRLKIPVNRMTVWAPSDVSGGSTTGSIANVEKGSLFLLFFSDTAPAIDNNLKLEFEYKLTFEDVE